MCECNMVLLSTAVLNGSQEFIISRKNYFFSKRVKLLKIPLYCNILDVRQTEIHVARPSVPEPSSFEVDIAI
jgi:hypothetical protein